MKYLAVALIAGLAVVVGTAPWVLMPALEVPAAGDTGQLLAIVFAISLLALAAHVAEQDD